MTTNQQKLCDTIGKLTAQIVSQFDGTPEEFEAALVIAIKKHKDDLGDKKASPVDFVDTGLALSNAIAVETKSETAIKIVTALTETVDDAVHERFFELLGDVLKDYKEIKAAVKASKK